MLSLLIIIIIFLSKSECDRIGWCLNRCRTSPEPHKQLNIYFEYKKAVIVPMTSPRQLPGNKALERHLRHLVNVSVKTFDGPTLRDFQVVPVQDACSAVSFNKTRQQIKCKPRPFILDVIALQGKVTPDKILTKQCQGYCAGSKKCQPIRTVNESVSVQVLLPDKRVQCAKVLVPRDVKCRCQCATEMNDCNAVQVFDRNKCACACTNKNEEKHCYAKIEKFKLHMWDPKTCGCACKTENPCTTGKIWDKISCKCVRKSHPVTEK